MKFVTLLVLFLSLLGSQSHPCSLQGFLHVVVLGRYLLLFVEMFLVSCTVQSTSLLVQIVLFLLKRPLSIHHLLLSICCCIPRLSPIC